jgi:hypothetical protein
MAMSNLREGESLSSIRISDENKVVIESKEDDEDSISEYRRFELFFKSLPLGDVFSSIRNSELSSCQAHGYRSLIIFSYIISFGSALAVLFATVALSQAVELAAMSKSGLQNTTSSSLIDDDGAPQAGVYVIGGVGLTAIHLFYIFVVLMFSGFTLLPCLNRLAMLPVENFYAAKLVSQLIAKVNRIPYAEYRNNAENFQNRIVEVKSDALPLIRSVSQESVPLMSNIIIGTIFTFIVYGKTIGGIFLGFLAGSLFSNYLTSLLLSQQEKNLDKKGETIIDEVSEVIQQGKTVRIYNRQAFEAHTVSSNFVEYLGLKKKILTCDLGFNFINGIIPTTFALFFIYLSLKDGVNGIDIDETVFILSYAMNFIVR